MEKAHNKDICVYRRRGITLLLMVLFGAVTIVMIIGLIQSYFPKYTGLSDLKITGTGRMISIIFTLFMAGITWRYVTGFLRRHRVPVIRITDDRVCFNQRVNEPEVLYFHDVESFSPIEGNFETAVVNYRVKVPNDDPRYPVSIEVPIGLTMTRAHVLAILNKRCAEGASLPAPRIEAPGVKHAPAGRDTDNEECESRGSLPSPDKTVRVYWERMAPVVLEVGILLIIGLLYLVKTQPDMADDYLWFIKLSTWCQIIIAVFIVAAVVILIYLIVALASPKLIIYPRSLRYRGVTVDFDTLRDVTVESKSKRVSQNRYVTEHFIRFNPKDTSRDNLPLPGLDPDLLEMRPKRIAAIINSRIACLKNTTSHT